eukprot:4663961-Pyramimonas_sp.AAC.1
MSNSPKPFADSCYVAPWATCARPHRPFVLRMRGGPRQMMVPRFKKPSALPLHRPSGCEPRPLDWGDLQGVLTQGPISKETLDTVTSQWVQRAELALVRVLQVDAEPRCRGRGGPPKVIQVRLLGLPASTHPRAIGE